MILKSSLCDHSDAYIIVKRTVIIIRAGVDAAAKKWDEQQEEVIFRNYAPFTDWIIKKFNTQVDNSTDLDVVTPIYNLIKISDNYSKTFRSLW